MAEPATGALKRKLDALGYTNAGDACDTLLVRQMVDDLIHTTDCYLALKQQASAGMQHVNHLADKVDVLTKDAERLAGENNELHLRLIQQAEKAESSMREHVKKRKNMEDSVAELTFCKTTLSTKSATLEKENAALQAKLQEVLKDLEACHQAVSDGEDMPERPLYLDAPEPLLQSITEAQQQPRDSFSADNVDVQQPLQECIAALEADAKERETELHSAKQDLESLQVAMEMREAEIVRLGEEATRRGANADAMALQHRCGAQESLILQLTEQVDSLKNAVKESDAEAKRREDVSSHLAESDRTRMELEFKLKDALRENATASREVKSMRASLKSLQLSKLRQPSRGRRQQDEPGISESTSRALQLAEQRLAEAAAELQRRAGALRDVTSKRDAALAEVTALKVQLQETKPLGVRKEDDRKVHGTDIEQLKDQVRFLTDEQAVLVEDRARAAAEAATREKQLADRQEECVKMGTELAAAERHVQELECALRHMTAEKDKALERKKVMEAEGAQLRQALTSRAAEGSPTEAERCRQAEQLLAQQLGVCSRTAEELAQAQQQLGAAAEQASATQAQCTRLQGDLDAARAAQERDAGRAHALQHELQQACQLAEERSRELTQLQEVSVQADAALQQCLAQLQALQGDLAVKEDALDKGAQTHQLLQAETDRLRKAYERERDAACMLQQDKTAVVLKLKAKEQELKDALQQQQVTEQAAACVDEQAQTARRHQQEHAEENAALKHEIQAAAEDLEALVRENQMIGHQLIALTAERDRWQSDTQASAERAQRAETLARSAESEVLRLRGEHEALLAEHRYLESNHATLERATASCQGELAARCDDLAVLRDAHAAAEAQVTQHSYDAQAWEGQVAGLSRQLGKVTAEKEDVERERQTLLDSLRASEQARFQQEQQCQQLQQQAAALSGKVHALTGRCEGAESDAQALQRRVGLEAERVADLELLLNRLRASQYHLQGSTQRGLGQTEGAPQSFNHEAVLARTSKKAASLEASLASAEAQIGALQGRVRELTVQNASLGASLSAARAERNALNAAVRASTSAVNEKACGQPSWHEIDSGALAAARADAAQYQEENTRLLDLLSRVGEERAALERANRTLRGGSAAAGESQRASADGDAEAARLALELAQEKSQRLKAENDFEELLENLERQAGRPDSPVYHRTDADMGMASLRGMSQGNDTPHSIQSSRSGADRVLPSPLSSGTGSEGLLALSSSTDSRHRSTAMRPSGALAGYVQHLRSPIGYTGRSNSYDGSSQAASSVLLS